MALVCVLRVWNIKIYVAGIIFPALYRDQLALMQNLIFAAADHGSSSQVYKKLFDLFC